jgi:hypothetical protein
MLYSAASMLVPMLALVAASGSSSIPASIPASVPASMLVSILASIPASVAAVCQECRLCVIPVTVRHMHCLDHCPDYCLNYCLREVDCGQLGSVPALDRETICVYSKATSL